MGRVIVQQVPEQLDGRPHGLAVDDLGRRGDDDAEERDDGEAERDADDLGPDGVTRAMGAGREVRGVGYQGGHVANAAHRRDDHLPPEGGPVESAGLVDDGSDALGLHDAPWVRRAFSAKSWRRDLRGSRSCTHR